LRSEEDAMAARVLALMLVVAPLAGAAPPVWLVEVSPAYATAFDIRGPAGAATVLREVNGWLAVGVTFDAARLTAAGQTPVLQIGTNAPLGGPYRFGIGSTFAGAAARAQLALGRFFASAELAAGWTEVRPLYGENTQCGYWSGFDTRLATGVAFAVTPGVLLGARAALRSPGPTWFCLEMLGPWAFNPHPALSFGPTAAVRF
jgi:hypothetical protein